MTILSIISLSAQETGENEQITAGLHIEVETLSFERPFWVGFTLALRDGESIPFNSKFKDSQNWQLPEGFKLGQVLYPLPQVLLDDGQAANFTKPVSLLFEIIPPPSYEVPQTFALLPYGFKFYMKWDVCEFVCAAQEQSFSFELLAGGGAIDDAQRPFFYMARQASLPPMPWPVEAYINDNNYRLHVIKPDATQQAGNYVFIPTGNGFQGSIAQQIDANDEGGVSLSLKGGGEVAGGLGDNYFRNLSGIFASEDQGVLSNGYRVIAPNMVDEVIIWSPTQPISAPQYSLIMAIVLAFIGGLILNLMPCVFPVLAMKAFQLASSSHKSSAEMRQDGVAYTLGIVLSFVLVAGILILVRNMGGMVGWGFQLQSPIFVLLLIWVMATVSLNFLGLFELRLAALQGVGQGGFLTRFFGGGERATAFSTGVLATVVATPCTAPFMAPAIGFALMQPPVEALSIFTALGLGLAFPYLLLSFLPALSKFLPKSGPWMLKVRAWLALPLGLTIIWLFWVLGQQVTIVGLMGAALSLALLALGLYLWGLNVKQEKGGRLKYVIFSLIAGLLLVFYVGSSRMQKIEEVVLPGIIDGLETITWSPEAVLAYREEDRAIFLNVTAAWCITCIVHEKLVFENDSFQAYMRENNIIYMVADWTNPDARIAGLLEQNGRSGIPFYLFYPAENSKDPVLLPEILTPASTISILEDNQ